MGGLTKNNSLSTRVRAEIDSLIEQGDYSSAHEIMDRLQGAKQLSIAHLRAINFLRLKAYNRQQCLVEAQQLVRELQGLDALLESELLEIALYFVLTAQLENAEDFFKKALSINKRSVLLVSELAILYEQQGKQARAIAVYDKLFSRALENKKVDAVFARVLARIAGLRRLSDSELSSVESMRKKVAGQDLEIRLLFGLAKAYSKRKEFEKELAALERANRLSDQLNESLPGQPTVEESRLKTRAIKTLFDKPCPDWMPQSLGSDKSPLFILGMPRSGTTLLEQILGAHSRIDNSGESRAMGIAFRRHLISKPLNQNDPHAGLPFVRYKSLTTEDLSDIIRYYDEYQSIFSSVAIITDKELSNIERIGMIAALYPKAKFLCIKRQPLDVAVSIMQHDFAQAYFSNSSLKIVQEYESYYEKATHWQSLFPERFMSIEYETLVASFSSTAKSIVEFLALDWELAMDTFYERENSVRTPSLSQVRNKINSGSVEKWRRYEALIAPAQRYLLTKSTSVSSDAMKNNAGIK